jgi:hypothetical protein
MEKRALKFLLLLSVTVLIAGCKLAVIVAEGGEVRLSYGTTCVAGTICIVEVPDTYFSDSFEASPDEDWYFHKWNSGDRFFCGGSVTSSCQLSLQLFEGNEAVENLVASSEVFYLMPVFKDYPGAHLVDGEPRVIEVDGEKRRWLEPADFGDYSYNQVSKVCPGGVCSGTLPGSTIDLTGYIWASSYDVRFLFNAYREAGKAVLADFAYTVTDKSTHILDAMLSDPRYKDGEYHRGLIAIVLNGGEPYTAAGEINHIGSTSLGPKVLNRVWFWRAID